MSVIKYKSSDKIQISTHFNTSEFKCKCGKNHEILIDSDLISLLEKVIIRLNAKYCINYSGYRCSVHDKNVGGSGKGSHTQGKGIDCYFIGQDGKRIPSQKVCLALEDMGHKKGIGYRCGGGLNESGQTHIDVANRKWYGDESIKAYRTKSCCSSYYEYFGIKKDNTAGNTYTGAYPKLPGRGYFKNGDKGTEAKNLQRFLNWAVNTKLAVDGIIGQKTIASVKSFQKLVNIKQDGLFGKNSLSKAKEFKK